MFATVGIDLQSGQQRFVMGIVEFQDGISFITVSVGMFAVAQVLRGLEQIHCGDVPQAMRITGPLWLTREEFRRSVRSEEHTSELQSLMRISYAVFCLEKKKQRIHRDKQIETKNINKP